MVFDRVRHPHIGESSELCLFQVEVGADIVVSVSPWTEAPGPTVVLGKLDAWRLTASAIRRARLHG